MSPVGSSVSPVGSSVSSAGSVGSVVTAAEHAAGSAALGQTVPPQGVPVRAGAVAPAPSGQRARQGDEQLALPPALPSAAGGSGTGGSGTGTAVAVAGQAASAGDAGEASPRPTGRRRRALAAAKERAAAEEAPSGRVFALPPASADQDDTGQHEAALHHPADDHTPPQPHPAQAPTGRRRSHSAPEAPATGAPIASGTAGDAQSTPPAGVPSQATTYAEGTPARGVHTPGRGVALPPERGAAQPLPAEAAPGDPNSTQGRAISVRTLGQGVPFGQQIAEQQQRRLGLQQGGQAPTGAQQAPQIPQAPQPPLPPQASPAQQTPPAPQPQQPQQGSGATGPVPPQAPAPAQDPGPLPEQAPAQPAAAGQSQSHTLGGSVSGSGRRRRLSTPPAPAGEDRPENAARPHPQAGTQAQAQPQSRIGSSTEGTGRAYAIGAPDQDADEGPEPLDGPGGAVEVSNRPQPQPMDDELPPEPLDNPRRLLVWPAPDVTTQQALSDRGYRPVIVHSREEVDAQIAAFPAALFVDPLTGPITRTALQSLRQAAVAAEVPVLVTAGLGQATREAAYGADPAVLLKALAPRDSEQHPPRVLLIEEHEEIALALTATLERRGMQVARAESDADAVTLAAQMRPNLVVMDLMQVRRRRAGIIDWLRANGQLNRTPLVVYTAAVDQTELPRLAAGETVLFLAERSTSDEVQGRIVDLLAKIGTN